MHKFRDRIFADAFPLRNTPLGPYKDDLVSDIDSVYNKLVRLVDGKNLVKLHASIDTFAKKIFIQEKDKVTPDISLKKLKAIMALFFTYEQDSNGIDLRYDAFFASILRSSAKELPKKVRIVSWNYDSQFELAYREFTNDDFENLGVASRSTHFHNKNLTDQFSIFKINGIASFNEANMDFPFRTNFTSGNLATRIVELYKKWRDNQKTFFPSISFAWEDELENEGVQTVRVIDKAKESIKETKTLVIIGYSIPFFNREIDKQIIEPLKKLEKVYIQNTEPEPVLDRFLSIKDFDKSKIELIRNCDQFHLPAELSL